MTLTNVIREAVAAALSKARLPKIEHATVTGTVPLRIRMDGENDPLPVDIRTLTPVSVGDRVVVLIDGTDRLLLGKTSHITDTPWTRVTMMGGWVDQSVGGWTGARYRVRSGRCELEGRIWHQNNTPWTPAFRLPLTPEFADLHMNDTHSAMVILADSTTGPRRVGLWHTRGQNHIEISCGNAGDTGFITLTGISFAVKQ